jgi:signal-transduction protein with cAMP-binding, CBS, and nucleotidyltransferase domain
MKFGARTWGKQDVRSGRERGLRRGLRGLNHDRKRSPSEALPLNIGQILKSKSRGVSTARSDDTIEAIAAQLSQRKIGAIVVVGDGGRVIGIISERDSRALTMPASAGMTHDVKTCTRDCTVDQIMEAMTNGRFRHLPVVENGALIGIISIGDVVKYHTAEVELEVSAMRGYLATG